MPRMPSGLGPSGKKLWRAVVSEYDLSAHHLILLKEASLVCDEIARLQAFVTSAAGNESLHVQREARAAVVELRLQRLLLSRLLTAMHFPED